MALSGLALADIPSFEQVKTAQIASEAWLLDRHGQVLAQRRMDNKEKRLAWVGLHQLSPAMQQALLAAEDKRFFQHSGVDWRGMAAAAWDNVWRGLEGRRPRGASTLTMQLAGFLDANLSASAAGRSLSQKWDQATAAQEIEERWSKPQILEAYLNLAPFRGDLIGIHAAARALFDKHPSGLDQAESLLLASLLRAPGAGYQVVARRACATAAELQEAGQNTPTCRELEGLALAQLSARRSGSALPALAPHVAARYLANARPGAKVITTLDARVQTKALDALQRQMADLRGRNVADGAVIVLDNASGDVLAWVGSSGDYSAAPEVDGVLALRQAGSTLKPFLYGQAVEKRLISAAAILEDAPLAIATDNGLYVPQNYERDFKGPVSARSALASSLNVPAVRVLQLVGLEAFAARLNVFSLDSVDQDGDYYGYGLALGAAEVRLSQLTNAYRALANGGIWSQLQILPQARNKVAPPHRALSPQAAFIISDVLSDRAARALSFGLENPLATRIWTAVKTGTSKDMRDNWCIGFSERYTVGVWVGNADGSPMHDVSGVTGAAPIWRELMHFLHSDQPSHPPKPPAGVVSKAVRYQPALEAPRREWFLPGTEPPGKTGEIQWLAQNNPARPNRITQPVAGSILALDPDMPASRQRLRLSAQGEAAVVWFLDGERLTQGQSAWWAPSAGRHTLQLQDEAGKVLDEAAFEVRGPGKRRKP